MAALPRGDHSVAVALEGLAAAREPRAAAEEFRQLLIEQLEKNYGEVKVTFRNLEDLDTRGELERGPDAERPLRSQRHLQSETPATQAKTEEPANAIAKSK